jgi:hypothetical protein
MAYCGAEQYRDASGKLLPALGRPVVVYKFVTGPLIRMIERAILDTEHPYYLIIEEINRGNCAAIFGDLFQLLDRRDDGSSEYEVRVESDLMQHLLGNLPADIKADEAVRRNFSRLKEFGLFIPGNLSLLATMNTSDQSLYPMDSAMKRRWEMTYVTIDYEQAKGRRVDIQGYGNRAWGDVLRRLNKAIVMYTQNDDRQIGQWFIGTESIDADTFRDKILSYLWFDVFRHKPGEMFNLDYSSSYEALIGKYDKGLPVFKAGILDEPVVGGGDGGS